MIPGGPVRSRIAVKTARRMRTSYRPVSNMFPEGAKRRRKMDERSGDQIQAAPIGQLRQLFSFGASHRQRLLNNNVLAALQRLPNQTAVALRRRDDHYQIGVGPDRFIRLRYQMNSRTAAAQFIPPFTTPGADGTERRLPVGYHAVQRPQISPQNITRSDNSDSNGTIE